MTGKLYLDLLKEKLVTHMNIHEASHFLHDSAPCHRAEIVSSWLTQQNISVTYWPGNSPDLKTIENMWSILKTHVARAKSFSLCELQDNIRQKRCLEITPSYCTALAESIPTCINKVLKNHG